MSFEQSIEIGIEVNGFREWVDMDVSFDLDEEQASAVAVDFIDEWVYENNKNADCSCSTFGTLSNPFINRSTDDWFEIWLLDNFVSKSVVDANYTHNDAVAEMYAPIESAFKPLATIDNETWCNVVEDTIDEYVMSVAQPMLLLFMQRLGIDIVWDKLSDVSDCDFKHVTNAFVELLWQMGLTVSSDGKEF